MRGKVLCFLHIVKHKNGTRSVPGCIPTRSVGNDHGAAGRDWSAVRPPSSERRPEQARSHRVRSTPVGDWSAVRASSLAGQLPQWFGVHLQEIGRLAGRHRWQASSHRVRCTSAGDWSAGGAPSLASQLPQWTGYTCKRLVGWQAAIAGRPAPTVVRCTSAGDWAAGRASSLAGQLPQWFGAHLQEIGRLAGRHRRQASSHSGSG